MAAPTTGSIFCVLDTECLNNGYCASPNTTEASCSCYRGYSGDHCEIGIQDRQQAFFIVHLIIFIAAFALFMVIAMINTVAACIMYHRKSGKVVDWTIIFLFALVTIGCLDRVLWLAIDPYWAYRIIPIRLDNVFYGFGQWSIVAEAIIVVVAWSSVYNSFNVKPWVRYVKPVGVTGVVLLMIVEILQDALRQSVPGARRGIFSTVYSVLLLVSVVACCAGFLLYGRRLYRSLSLFKNESENVKYMRRLQSITNAVSIVAVVIAIVIAIASFARIWFRTYQTWLAWETLFRLIEAGVHLVILQTFSFHRYWRLAFCPSRCKPGTSGTGITTGVTASLDSRRSVSA